MQSKSFIQSDDQLSSFFSPGTLNYSISPKMYTSPSVYLNSPMTVLKSEPLSAEKTGITHHRISGNSQVKVMTPISSIGLMGPPENPPTKSEQQLTSLDSASNSNLLTFEHSSPASSSSSSATGGYYFDYALNSQPNNFTSTPVIMTKSLQSCQSSQINDGKTVGAQ